LRGLKKGLDTGKTHKPQQGMGAFQAFGWVPGARAQALTGRE